MKTMVRCGPEQQYDKKLDFLSKYSIKGLRIWNFNAFHATLVDIIFTD